MSTESNQVDDEMMIDVPESQLYVRVRGNPEKPLIINLHGGPGGFSGIDIGLMGPYLEDKYLVAYLDQRGCGKSLACSDTSFLLVEQYVEDLDIVVDSLMSYYQKGSVNLMGTSWGGMYGFLYILTYQKKVKSYACIDGKVNSYFQNHSLIDYEIKRANELLLTNICDSKKNELELIIKELNRIKNSNFEYFYSDVNWIKHEVPPKLGFNAYFADTSKIISFNDVLNDTSLMRLMKYSEEDFVKAGEKAETVNKAFRNNIYYNNINIENELSKINIPTAVIQGDQDYVVGRGQAKLIFNALTGLTTDKKELHIIPETGHCPAIEAPEKLSKILITFFGEHN
jgi:pimeloyl-ACP methyl ester carboxylesterase